jgi:putative ABC transport system ATP-binding protein
MGDTILRVDDIQKFYGNKGNLTKAIDHISFSVRKGEFLGIMGASGSGKTTLLNCISTIDTVTSGHIYVEEKDITMLHRAQLADFRGKKLGFIFQNFNLLDTLTAYENISLAFPRSVPSFYSFYFPSRSPPILFPTKFVTFMRI